MLSKSFLFMPVYKHFLNHLISASQWRLVWMLEVLEAFSLCVCVCVCVCVYVRTHGHLHVHMCFVVVYSPTHVKDEIPLL